MRVADSVGTDGTYDGLFSVSTTGLLAVSSGSSASRQLTWFDRQGKIRLSRKEAMGETGQPAGGN